MKEELIYWIEQADPHMLSIIYYFVIGLKTKA